MGFGDTDSSGNYQIGGLPSGNYTVFTNDESNQYQMVWYDEASSFAASTPVSVTVPRNTPNIDLTLQSGDGDGGGGGGTQGGKITGTVFRDDGTTPLPGVVVGVMPIGDPKTEGTGEPPMAMSGNDGKFEVENLSDGEYIVFASSTGFVTQYWEETDDQASSTPVMVSSTSTPQNINFSPSFFGGEGATITGVMIGRVTQQDNSKTATGTVAGIAGATVSATPLAGGIVRNATTNVNGDYVFAGLTPGTYEVRAMAAGYLVEWWEEVDNSASSTPVTIASTTVTGINFTLDVAAATSSNGFITGTVTEQSSGNPISGATVTAKPLSGGPDHLETTDSSGNYTFDIAPGEHLVSAWAFGFALEYYSESETIASSTTVLVSTSTPQPNINITLVAGGAISGSVMDAASTSTPITSAKVVVTRVGGTPYSRSNNVDSSGNYKVSNLPVGSYTVKSEAGGFADEWWDEVSTLVAATNVSVTAGANQTGINFTMN
jgi:hypothetical protein